jgi:formylmethanofuran dehydrogenase subunit A
MLGILNGRVYDPANGVDGQVQDIWVQDGRIVAADQVPNREAAEIFDAAGLVVMPGGVDMHSHIAGSKVNAGRRMCPEDHRADTGAQNGVTRSGGGHSVPTTFATGYHYLEMGYTTVMEAAMPPLLARHTHEEMNDVPLLDKGAYTLMGNNRFLLGCLGHRQKAKARDFAAWLLEASRGYAIKIVNPGGVENWKAGKRETDLDDPVLGWDATPREIILALADISTELGLPHGPHLHVNRLGQAGNASTTIRTIEALDGRRTHLAHLQFASYGGGGRHPLRSAAA